jgi:very-short-patch-repair endonuclease
MWSDNPATGFQFGGVCPKTSGRHECAVVLSHFPLPWYSGGGRGWGLIPRYESITIVAMHIPRDADRRLTGFARAMRKEPTDAEKKLWRILRMKNLEGYRFRRQRPVAGYILDFYCPTKRLAVELDGGQHADDHQADYDRCRTKRLTQMGVCILRFWDDQILKHPDVVAEEILRHLEGK